MPRKARQKSDSGIYHIIMGGINRQFIFEDEEDCENIFKQYSSIKRKADLEEKHRITEEQAKIMIKEVCKVNNTSNLQKCQQPRPRLLKNTK